MRLSRYADAGGAIPGACQEASELDTPELPWIAEQKPGKPTTLLPPARSNEHLRPRSP